MTVSFEPIEFNQVIAFPPGSQALEGYHCPVEPCYDYFSVTRLGPPELYTRQFLVKHGGARFLLVCDSPRDELNWDDRYSLNEYVCSNYHNPDYPKSLNREITEVMKGIIKELDINAEYLTLAGGAIRDLYFNKTPNDWDIWVLNTEKNSPGFDLIQKYLDHKFPKELGESNQGLQRSQGHLPNTYTIFSNWEPFGKYLISGQRVNLIATSEDSPYNIISGFDFDINQCYWYQGILSAERLIIAAQKGEMSNSKDTHHKITYEVLETHRAQSLLDRGVRISDRLGIKFNPHSVEALVSCLPVAMPLEENIVLTGFRGYQLTQNRSEVALRGGASHMWDTNTLEAECSGSKTVCVEHLLSQKHLCGINAYKGIPERQYLSWPVIAQCQLWGVVRELEHGYRAQYARMLSLWIVKDQVDDFVRAQFISMEGLVKELSERYKIPVQVTDKVSIRQLIRSNQRLTAEPPRKWSS